MKKRVKKFYQILMLLNLGIGLIYLSWRMFFTMNPGQLFWSIALVCAEAYGFFSLFLFYFQLWSPTSRGLRPVLKGKKVDVFITTFKEDPDVIRKTVKAAIAMDYPHKTYVLDDGKDPKVRKICKELGCYYITREDNRYAKAGNLNNALKETNGEFILTLDADCVPRKYMIKSMIGYFKNNKVAVVQAPQHFYNYESFQHRKHIFRRERIYNEQDQFFRIIQPGRDYWNASFFCGCPAMLKRKAILDVGGFARETITEDIHTNFRMHKKKWGTVYLNHVVATSIAPRNLQQFLIQRSRWAAGTFQMFLIELRSFFSKGLTLPQKICYFSSLLYFMSWMEKLIYILMPVVFLLFGIKPVLIYSMMQAFLIIFYYAFKILVYEIVTHGYGHTLFTEAFTIGVMFTYMKSFFTALVKKRLAFKVTNGLVRETRVLLNFMLSSTAVLFLFSLIVIAVIVGFVNLMITQGTMRNAIIINLFWANYNLVSMFIYLSMSIGNTLKSLRQEPELLHTPKMCVVMSAEDVNVLSLEGLNTSVCVLHTDSLPARKRVTLRLVFPKRAFEIYPARVYEMTTSGKKRRLYRITLAYKLSKKGSDELNSLLHETGSIHEHFHMRDMKALDRFVDKMITAHTAIKKRIVQKQ